MEGSKKLLNAREMRNKSLRCAKEIIREKIDRAADLGSTKTRIYFYRNGLQIDLPQIVKKCVASLEENNYVVKGNIDIEELKDTDIISHFHYIDVEWRNPPRK